nr:MAG TPA: hypothetical protein [Caudoviricetes sp.]
MGFMTTAQHQAYLTVHTGNFTEIKCREFDRCDVHPCTFILNRRFRLVNLHLHRHHMTMYFS